MVKKSIFLVITAAALLGILLTGCSTGKKGHAFSSNGNQSLSSLGGGAVSGDTVGHNQTSP